MVTQSGPQPQNSGVRIREGLTEANNARQGSTADGVAGQRAYAFWLVVIAIGAVTLIFITTVSVFNAKFEDANQVISALASVFAVVGTLTGAYFGVKASSDARQVAENAREQSVAVTRTVLAESDPNVARQALERTPGPTEEQGQ